MALSPERKAQIYAENGLAPDGVTPLNQQAGPPPDDSVVKNSLDRGVGGLAKDFGKLTEVVGAEKLGQGMQRWGQETVDHNPVQAESFGESPGTWIAERAIESIPAVAGYATGGGLAVKGATMAARGLAPAATKLAAKQAAKPVAQQAYKQAGSATTKAARRKAGTKAGQKAYDKNLLTRGQKTAATVGGMSAFGFPMHTGSNLNFQEEQGDEIDLGRAAGSAIVPTALDTFTGIGGVTRKAVSGELGKQARGEAVDRMAKFRNIPKEAAKVSGQEALIEGAQTANQYLFASPDMDVGYERLSSPEGVEELLFSIGAGAAGGSVFGGASGFAQTRAARNEKGRMADQRVAEEVAKEEAAAKGGAGLGEVDFNDTLATQNRKSADPIVRARQAADDAVQLRDAVAAAASTRPDVAAEANVSMDAAIDAGIEALEATKPTGQVGVQVAQMRELQQRQAQIAETARVLRDGGQLDDARAADVSAEIARIQNQLVDMLDSGAQATSKAQGAEVSQQLDDLMREMRKGRELAVQSPPQATQQQQAQGPAPEGDVITPRPTAGQQQPRVGQEPHGRLPGSSPSTQLPQPSGRPTGAGYTVGPDGQAAPQNPGEAQRQQRVDRATGTAEVAGARARGTVDQTDTSQLPRSTMTDQDRQAVQDIVDTAEKIKDRKRRNAEIALNLDDAMVDMEMQSGLSDRAKREHKAVKDALAKYVAATKAGRGESQAFAKVPKHLLDAKTPTEVVDQIMDGPTAPDGGPGSGTTTQTPAKKKSETAEAKVRQAKAQQEKPSGSTNQQASEEAPAKDADAKPDGAKTTAPGKSRTKAKRGAAGQDKGSSASRRDGQKEKAPKKRKETVVTKAEGRRRAGQETFRRDTLSEDIRKAIDEMGPVAKQADLLELLDANEQTLGTSKMPFVHKSAIPWNEADTRSEIRTVERHPNPMKRVMTQDPRAKARAAPTADQITAVERQALTDELLFPRTSPVEWVHGRLKAWSEVSKLIEKELAKPRVDKASGKTKPTGATGVAEVSWLKSFDDTLKRIALLEFWAVETDKSLEGTRAGRDDTQTAQREADEFDNADERADAYVKRRTEDLREMYLERDADSDVPSGAENMDAAQLQAMYDREMELNAAEHGVSEYMIEAKSRVQGRQSGALINAIELMVAEGTPSSVVQKHAAGLPRGFESTDLKQFQAEFPGAPFDAGAISRWYNSTETANKEVADDEFSGVSQQDVFNDDSLVDTEWSDPDDFGSYWSGAAPEGFGKGRAALLRAVASGNGKAVHAQVSKMLSGVKELQPMVRWAKAALENSKIVYKPEMKFTEDGRPIHAEYNASTDTITVYKGGEHPVIILHEAVHAATERGMTEAREAIASGKIPNARVRRLVEAYRDLTKLYRDFKKEMPDSKSYGFTSEGEFVAEALSNPDFRAELQTKPETSLWARLVEFVRKMIGLPKRDSGTLHDVFTAAQTVAYNAPGASYMPSTMRIMMHTFSGPAQVARAQRAAHEIPTVEKWMSTANAKVRKAVLGFNTRHHITERFQSHLRGLTDFAIGNDKQSSLATTLNNNLGRFSGEHLKWMGENKKTAEKLWTGMNLQSQFRISEDQMNDLLAGKYTFDTLKQAKIDEAHKLKESQRVKSIERHWEMLGRQNFDRMVTSMRAVGWKKVTRELDPRRMSTWKANDWGHYIFQLSREDALRTYEQSVRVAAFRATGNIKVNDMTPEAAEQYLKDSGQMSNAAEEALAEARREYKERERAPYVPSHRTGDYFASIRTMPDAEGKSKEGPQTLMFMRFKTKVEAEAAAADLAQQDQVKNQKDVVVTHGQISKLGEDLANSDALLGMVNTLTENLETSLPGVSADDMAKIKEAAFQSALRMLPETSSLKSYIHREGVPGWDPREQLEGFTMHMTQSNYSYANNRYLPEVERALKMMKENVQWLQSPDSNRGNPEFEAQIKALKKAGSKTLDPVKAKEVTEEMQRRFVANTKVIESPALDTLRSFTYNYQLAWSPGYLIANLSQPYVLTLPTLGARYGFRKGTKALMDGYGDAMHVLDMMLKDGFAKPLITEDVVERLRKAGKLSTEDIDVIKHMLESGKVEFTLAKEAGEISHGAESRAKMARMLSAPAHYVEVTNRISSGLAAARLERNRIKGKRRTLTDADVEKVNATSTWAIDETQFNYNRLNQSRLMSKEGVFGKMTPLFTVFLSYSVNVMEKYARLMRASFNRTTNNPAERAEARRGLAGMLMTTGSLAGIGGLPFMGIIFAMVNILTDEEDDSEAQWRAWLANTAGKDAAYAMHYGLPAALGWNAQMRVGQHDIMPFTRAAFGEKTLEDMSAAEFLGNTSAALGTGIGVINMLAAAPQWIANGDNSAGVDTIRGLPAAIRGVATAAHGYYDPAGNPIPGEGGAMDALQQSMGFMPTQRHEQLFLALATHHRDTRVAKNASHIRRNWAHALHDGDKAEAAKWQKEAMKFIKRNPGQAHLATGMPETVKRMATERALMGLDHGKGGPVGVALSPKQLHEQQPILDAVKLGG